MGPAAQWNPRQRSGVRITTEPHHVLQDCQFSTFRNRQQFRILNPQLAGARLIGAHDVELILSSVPRSAVHDAAVGSEPRSAHRASSKCDLLKLRQSWFHAVASHPPGQPRRRDNQGCYRDKRQASTPSRESIVRIGIGVDNCCLRAGSRCCRAIRQRLQIERHIARRLKALRRILLQAMPDKPLERHGILRPRSRKPSGSSFRIALIVSAGLSPRNARLPESIS